MSWGNVGQLLKSGRPTLFFLGDIFGVTILKENLDVGFHCWGFLSDVDILFICWTICIHLKGNHSYDFRFQDASEPQTLPITEFPFKNQ